jgi:hypothetical protein
VECVLPNERVFVIQLSSHADPGDGRLVGRVEHVQSGRSTRFASSEEMIGFFVSVLRDAEKARERGQEI